MLEQGVVVTDSYYTPCVDASAHCYLYTPAMGAFDDSTVIAVAGDAACIAINGIIGYVANGGFYIQVDNGGIFQVSEESE